MRKRFHVTYDIVTNESAERGDIAESGFVTPGEWRNDMSEAPNGPDFEPIKAEHALTLAEAIDLIGLVSDNGNGSFYEVDGRDNYTTGDHETRALHCPDNITVASLGRVTRLLAARRLLTN